MFKIHEKIRNNGVYIIAEMSANHAGKLENALEIVKKAAYAGASCLKIQTYTADTITIDCHSELFKVHGGLWDNEYLYDYFSQYLNTGLFAAEIKKYDNGTAQPNLGARDLAKFLVPIPPLSEQHRIVEQIKQLFTLCEKIMKCVKTFGLSR